MRGQRGVWMGCDLRGEGRFIGRTNQPGSPRTWTGAMTPGLDALSLPATNRGWINPEHGGDISHTKPSIHRGQGSFTDVVRGVRALHRPTLADTHLI